MEGELLKIEVLEDVEDENSVDVEKIPISYLIHKYNVNKHSSQTSSVQICMTIMQRKTNKEKKKRKRKRKEKYKKANPKHIMHITLCLFPPVETYFTLEFPMDNTRNPHVSH